jgi:hypothetical protein
MKNRRYDGRFCCDVFKAIGRQKNQEDWDSIFKRADVAINEIRATQGNRVKESMDGEHCFSIEMIRTPLLKHPPPVHRDISEFHGTHCQRR